MDRIAARLVVDWEAARKIGRQISEWAAKAGVTGSHTLALVERKMMREGKSLEQAVQETYDLTVRQYRRSLGDELFEDMKARGQFSWIGMTEALKKMSRISAMAERVAADNHKDFDNKRDALAFLRQHPLMSVGWPEGGKQKAAIYWSGKLVVTDADEKRYWAGERVARWSESELKALYGELFSSKDKGVRGLVSLISSSIWKVEEVDWRAVKKELESFPEGRAVARGMEALPKFADISTKGYHAVRKEMGVPLFGKAWTPEFEALVEAWEGFERKVLRDVEDAWVEYRMGMKSGARVAKDEWVLQYEAWIDSLKTPADARRVVKALNSDRYLAAKDREALLARMEKNGFKVTASAGSREAGPGVSPEQLYRRIRAGLLGVARDVSRRFGHDKVDLRYGKSELAGTVAGHDVRVFYEVMRASNGETAGLPVLFVDGVKYARFYRNVDEKLAEVIGVPVTTSTTRRGRPAG